MVDKRKQYVDNDKIFIEMKKWKQRVIDNLLVELESSYLPENQFFFSPRSSNFIIVIILSLITLGYYKTV